MRSHYAVKSSEIFVTGINQNSDQGIVTGSFWPPCSSKSLNSTLN